MHQNSSSFIAFQCILHDSGVLFSGFSNLYKLKRGDLISGGNQFCRMSELFGPPFCISILKVFQTQILCHSLDLNVFCMIQQCFSEGFSNLYKLKRGDLISGGNQFCRISKLFGAPSCILILKVFQTQILHHSLHFHVFCMIQQYLSQGFQISIN